MTPDYSHWRGMGGWGVRRGLGLEKPTQGCPLGARRMSPFWQGVEGLQEAKR